VRPLRTGKRVLIGGLACWLGLIAWTGLSAGGVMPSTKSDPKAIRVVTWNILHGRDHGSPWTRYGWSARKTALESAVTATEPDIFCVQEALAEQVDSIAAMLPHHNHVGVGRDDGKAAGEYCAIFYDSRRFGEVRSGTFWLEEPTDEPPAGVHLGPKRICTWARLFERSSGRFIRVYNTHLYLTEKSRRSAVRVILAKIAEGDSDDALLVTGDFNAPPRAASRLLFEKAGLLSAAKAAGGSAGAPTYHFYGIRLRNLDEIFCSPDWNICEARVLDVKPGNTYPSDHFGVLADVALRR
jgi:endonuclease/exonuclease/phosphatase family metal-dependent hydrolase